jgi:hypothetical protein
VSSTQRCEDIVAAPKFMVCRDDAFELYKYDLLNTFSRFRFSSDRVNSLRSVTDGQA